MKALVEYMSCRGKTNTWPATKNTEFWAAAAEFIAKSTSRSCRRTGNACRNKVLKTLRKKYTSPEEAKAHYFTTMLCASEPYAAGIEASITPELTYSEISKNQQLRGISEALKSYCVQMLSCQMIY